MMDSLYFLQFACFIFMLINALILGITHLHMKWVNRRYEWSRWLILAGMTGLAIQYLLQMLLGFRAKGNDLGAIFNILVYTPCITTIAMGIYNIEATHANRRKMNIVCACIYAAIIAAFCIGYSNSGSLNIGNWLYAMLVLFGANVAYCIYMIMVEMRKRKKMLELMTGGDMLPYVRFARASVFSLFLSALTMPFAILSTTLLYIIGPLALLSILFFNLSFVALGYKDTSVNMFTLSRSLNISKNELARYFTSCLNSSFRIWLAEVRFEAAKKMMLDYPDYNNDIISAECGFSSRSYLYRIFKEKEGCSPTVWRAENC